MTWPCQRCEAVVEEMLSVWASVQRERDLYKAALGKVPQPQAARIMEQVRLEMAAKTEE